MRKYFSFFKLGLIGSVKLILAYFKIKFLGYTLNIEQNAIIHHYNFILAFNLEHKKWGRNDAVVSSEKFGDLAIRKFPTSDMNVFKQVCIDNEYGHLITLVHNKLTEGRITMIDGGANIGLTSIALFVSLSPKYQLESVLVEPFSENLRQIKKNIELQKITGFTLLKAGITNKPGFLELDYSYRDSLEWSIQIKESLIPTEIKSIEICEILDQKKWEIVDILKLDIEGAEGLLFQDRNYAKFFLRRVCLLAIEIHEEYISKELVLEILKEEGFHMTPHGELHIGYNCNLLS